MPPNKRAGGTAQDKSQRAFNAILTFNEAAPTVQAKWAISQAALAKLTGSNQPAIKLFVTTHLDQIAAHHQKHGLVEFHNTSKGKLGFKIENQVTWQ